MPRLLVLISLLAACGGSSPKGAVDSGSDLSLSDAMPIDGASMPSDGGTVDAAGVDLTSDPLNCGAVGHACEQGCTQGLCDPVDLRTFTTSFTQWAVDGDHIYLLSGKNVYVGSTSSSTGDTKIATVPTAADQSNHRSFATTASYVYLWTATGGTTIDKTSHAVVSFTYPTGGAAFDYGVANDSALYWYDDSSDLWSVPMTGGTPTQNDVFAVTALAADPTGLYFQGGPQGGDTSGLWKLVGTTSTPLASNVGESFSIQVGATNVYGVTISGTTSDCAAPSMLWSVPKAGVNGGAGASTPLYSATYSLAPIVADDTSVVWSPCNATNVVELRPGDSAPVPLIAEAGVSPQLDGAYAYYVASPSGSSVAHLYRVAR